ncbi:hypothetical protein Mgra_00009951 [Meloidogyne graminicola]|uniref:Uncharacterized protein n=1 Tax=Meloidogyne graminicola TaxID=189291 RepID=A0A8S9ZAW8_9BILA|nr:hypothetical protein Mgra_00009951 [Meloidogyne graminicola]
MNSKQGTPCAKKNAIMQLSSSGLKIKKRTNKSKFIREILNNEALKKKEQKQLMEYSPEKTPKFKINTTCTSHLNFRGKLQTPTIKQHKEITTNKKNKNYARLFNRILNNHIQYPDINNPPNILTTTSTTIKKFELEYKKEEDVIPSHLQNRLISYNQSNEEFVKALEAELENELSEYSDED